MRLFIAVDFSRLKEYFLELQGQLPQDAKLSLAKSFHLTLKFLGEVQPDNVDEIAGSLRKIKFDKFSVSLDRIGVFPAENHIRVVWAGLNPEDSMIDLQKQIDGSLEKMFNREKSFKAHITLARVKSPMDNKSFAEEIRNIKIENKEIEVRDFRLMESKLTAQGPVYGGLEVFKF